MALSAGVTEYSPTYSTGNTYTKCRIGVKVNSRDIENNKWNITVTGDCWRTNSGYTSTGTGTFKCTIMGTEYKENITTSKKITQNSHTILFSKTLDVEASSDGSLSIVIAAQIILTNGSFAMGENKCTFNFERIPRASIPSISKSSIFIGDSVTIQTNRASNSFTHKLYYSINNSGNKLISDSVGVSYSWIPTSEIAKYITSDVKGKVKFTLDTYSYDTKLGTSTIEIEVKIPNTSEYYPVINSISYEDTNSEVKQKFNKILKTLSALKINIKATGVYSSTITAYKTVVNNETYNTSEFTTSNLKTKGISIVVSITDSRGRVTSQELKVDVIDYDYPIIRDFSAVRNKDNPSIVDISIDGVVCPIDNKNTVTGIFYYKEKEATSFNSVTYQFEKYDFKQTFQIDFLNEDKSYDIYFILKDSLSNTSSKDIPVSTAFRLINFNQSGKSFALGKLSELPNDIEIDIPIHVMQELFIIQNDEVIKLSELLLEIKEMKKKIEEMYNK